MIQRWFFGKGKQPESGDGQEVPPSAVEESLTALQHHSQEDEDGESIYQSLPEDLGVAAGDAKGKITFSVEDLGDREVTAVRARAVENMEHSVKREAIRIAKDILENLKIKCAGMSIKELIDSGNVPLMDEVLEGIGKVAGIFDHHLKIALRLDPELVKEEEMEEAIAALGIFQYHTTLRAADQAMIKAVMAEQKGEREHAAALRAQATAMRADIAAMPTEYKQGGSARAADLMAKVEKGIDRVVERMQQMTQSMMGDPAGISRDKKGGGKDPGQPEHTPSQQAWGEAQASQQNAANQQAQQQIALNAAKAIQEARTARQAARNTTTKQSTHAKATIAPPRVSDVSSQQAGAGMQSPNGPAPVNGLMGNSQAGADAVGSAGSVRRNSMRSTTAGVGVNKVRVSAPKVTPPAVPVTHHTPTQQPPAFGGMLDPSMLSSMQGRMASVAGQKTSDALAPNSAARTIATLKQEQEQQRTTSSTAKAAEKAKHAHDAHEHEEHEKAAARKAEQEKEQKNQPVAGFNPRKPTITR